MNEKMRVDITKGGVVRLDNVRLNFVKLVVGLLFMVVWASSGAVEVKNLYSSEVLVIDQSRAARVSATQDALAEVLIRVSGSPQILLHEVVRKELLKPEIYLLQYKYLNTNKTLLNKDGEAVAAKRLVLEFDRSLILQSLKAAGLPIWGANRARVLVWWGVENQGKRYLLSDGDDDGVDSSGDQSGTQENSGKRTEEEGVALNDAPIKVVDDYKVLIVESLIAQATRRGLPITLPLMDLEDTLAVNESDVWGFFTENIEAASHRYSPEAVLVGRAMQALSGEWLGSWMLLLDGKSYWFEGTSDSVEYLLAEAVDNMADRLGEKYAVVVGEDAALGLTLKVFDIKGLKHYADATAYLGALVPVRKARLRRVEGDQLTFNLQLDGDVEQFKQAIKLDDKLLPILVESRPPTGDIGVGAPSTLEFVGARAFANKNENTSTNLGTGMLAQQVDDDGVYVAEEGELFTELFREDNGQNSSMVIEPYLEYRWVGD